MKKASIALLIAFSFVLCSCSNIKDNTTPPKDVTYIVTTLKDMYQIYDKNQARYEAEYINKYLSIKGEVSSIISDDYFSIVEYQYNYHGQKVAYYGYATAKVKNDDLKDTVINLNEGDVVTIRGKVVEFSYTVTCDVILDVYDIIIDFE